MRSLFTQDIPGAKCRNLYYDKQLYRQKHLKEIERFGPKNPQQKRIFQWYSPPKRQIQPIDKDSNIVKPHSMLYLNNSSQLRESKTPKPSKYESYEVTGKVTEGISLKNSGIFSSAGRKSLADSFSKDLEDNPYFPHKYSNKHQQKSTLLTGKRDWKGDIPQLLPVPPASGQYYPKQS